jgi:hypothetical protein
MSTPSQLASNDAEGPRPRRVAWFRRHPRWAAFGVATIALVVAGVGTFLWIALPIGSHQVPKTTAMPSTYDEDRFFVEPVMANGAKLRLLTDTGGGMFLTRGAVERCRIKTSWSIGRGDVTRLNDLRADAWIPEPVGAQRWIPVQEQEGDGMLGQRWFAGGVWTFDYPRKTLLLSNSPFYPTIEQASHSAALGFPTWLGIRSGNHPRFVVTIDGQRVDSLFDTGATVRLTENALKVIGDHRPSERATSFVAASQFDRWRRDNPNWRVVEEAEQTSKRAIIEVPIIEVAGFKVGPAWFTRRPDANYEWMSSYMDQPIVASIGGNVLRNFRVTLDYPSAVAYFENESH